MRACVRKANQGSRKFDKEEGEGEEKVSQGSEFRHCSCSWSEIMASYFTAARGPGLQEVQG